MSKVRLGDYVKIKTGKLDANASSPDGEYPFFTCAVEPLKIDSYSYDCECVLVAGNGDLNVKYYDGKFDAYQRTYIIESKDKTQLSVPYLYRFLDAYIDTLRNQSIGGVIKYIKLGNLTEAPIVIPALQIQNKTVSILSFLDSLIEKANQQKEKLDELIKSRFVEMFGDLETNPMNWAVETIDNISIFLKSGLSRKLSDEDIGIPVIRSGNIQNGAFYPADIKYWYKDDPQGANTKDYILDDGDILINFINSVSQIGKAAIFRSIGRDCIYTTNLFRMKLADNCNEYYFNWFAMSDYYFRQIQSIIQPAVNQASFTTGNFLKLNIPLPPMEKQLHFATFVKEVDKSKLVVKQSIEKLETLKKSLMQEYFG